MKVKAQFGDVEFQFNPERFEYAMSNRWQERELLGVEVDPLDYSGGSGRGCEIIIFLVDDEAETGYVGEKIETLQGYARKDPAGNAPKAYLFNYGKFAGYFVITDFRVTSIHKYKETSEDRIAVCTLTVKEYVEDEVHRTPEDEKGDRYVIVENIETWRTLALAQYKNVDLWKCLADYNRKITLNSEGPIIPPGSEILIPTYDIAKTYLPASTTGGGLVSYDQ